jgi:hypothetical protein
MIAVGFSDDVDAPSFCDGFNTHHNAALRCHWEAHPRHQQSLGRIVPRGEVQILPPHPLLWLRLTQSGNFLFITAFSKSFLFLGFTLLPSLTRYASIVAVAAQIRADRVEN